MKHKIGFKLALVILVLVIGFFLPIRITIGGLWVHNLYSCPNASHMVGVDTPNGNFYGIDITHPYAIKCQDEIFIRMRGYIAVALGKYPYPQWEVLNKVVRNH